MRQSIIAILFAAIIATPGAAQLPAGALPESALRVANDVPSEPVPVPDEHYPVSNEWRHDLFLGAIRDLGGAFVGVGTDQCYTLAAAQRAEVVWIVDYDATVPLVHRLYGVLIAASPTPAELVLRFQRPNEAATRALLERELGSDPAGAEIVRFFRRNRGRFDQYLQHVARLRQDGAPTSWLSDPELYARVRALFAEGRIIARPGDLTGPETLRGVGSAAARLRVPVRVLYLSNAEAFFPYTRRFQENVRALPADDRSVVLRTFRHPRAVYPRGDTWHYLVQPMSDLVARFELGYRRARQIQVDAIRAGLSRTGGTVIGASTPRQAHRP